MKILDCTLRDGGYYTDWDFSDNLVNNYFNLVKFLPIDIIEVGYRGNKNKKSYLGEYYFLTKSKLLSIRNIIGKKKKISIMIELKDWKTAKELEKNLLECRNYVDIVRIAINPKKMKHIDEYLKTVSNLGFTVCVNLMYSHLILKDQKIVSNVIKLKKYFDIIYLVDSYGSLVPGNISRIIKIFKSFDHNLKLGFHSHNNFVLLYLADQ